MPDLHEYNALGQSIWYDNLRRALLDHGEMQALIDAGVTGVTSNPTIFDKAIVGSSDYDKALHTLIGNQPGAIYEALALEDIRRTADMLRPIYDRTGGADGFVSLEVSPRVAHDTAGSVEEARRLFTALQRPNVMIKIPGTSAGVPAIAQAIAEGINVNVTLLFSLAQYEAVIDAYMRGLEARLAAGQDISSVASVASFFVSRVDKLVDKALEEHGATDLQGKIAIDNARLAYARFKEVIASERWQKLAAQGATMQRPLWGSTGTKNPEYSDTLYVDNLIGPNTVNTMPPATLNAIRDHGTVAATLETDLDQARARMARLQELGISLPAITQQLQDDGVAAFAESFDSLMAGIQEKAERLRRNQQPYSASLGEYQAAVDGMLTDLRDNQIMQRIWAHDHTVWKPEPTEITNRLGWLHSPEVMPEAIPDIEQLVADVREAGYTHALLLGMGGSSLAPELFRFTFDMKEGNPDLAVLDSTDPGAVLAYADTLDPARTLFIVASKSGGTAETFSFFKFFYNWTANALGADQAGAHFVAITDPGSGLLDTAKKYHFRASFINDPNIGGRFSALSFFGLVAAGIVGIDLKTLLARAQEMACNCEGCNCPVAGDNSGAWLGAIMGELAVAGRDKVTLLTSPPINSFGAWVEQLIAESTGKEGKGILPVVDEEPYSDPAVYGTDRLFVYLRLADDSTHDDAFHKLREAGHPVVQINLRDIYDLGGEFVRWEIATAVASRRLSINPFDQPDVESAKVQARKMIATFQEKGQLPEPEPLLEGSGITVYGDVQASTPVEALEAFLSQHRPGDYLSIQAYVQPTAQTTETLQRLRIALRNRLHLATTIGYGPRFLHSTGQLHKGDGGNGMFIQFTADAPRDAAIPDVAGEPASSMSFSVLEASQALGDRQALLDNQRRVIRFHLADVASGLAHVLPA